MMTDPLNLAGLFIGVLGLFISVVMAIFYFRDRQPRLGNLKWKHIVAGVKKIANDVKKSGYAPEVVLGIHVQGIGGGAIVGEIIAVEENLPFSVVLVDIIKARDELGSCARILALDKNFIGRKRVLLVDDVCNSGRTLRLVRQELMFLKCEVKTAVVLAPPEHVVGLAPIDYFAFRSTTGQVYGREWVISQEKK